VAERSGGDLGKKKKKKTPLGCSLFQFIGFTLKKKKSRNLMFIYQYLAFSCHNPSTQPSKLRVKFKAINTLICFGYNLSFLIEIYLSFSLFYLSYSKITLK
jgi:hypothetical protein